MMLKARIVCAAMALGALILGFPASAQNAQTPQDSLLFFKGFHQCDDRLFVDNVMLRPVDGYHVGTMISQEVGTPNRQSLNIGISFSKMTRVVASDQDGQPAFAATPNEDLTVLQVQWLDKSRNPRKECEAFRLVKAENPKARYSALTDLLKTEDPRVSIARLVAQGQLSLPPLDFIPEAEQEAVTAAYQAVSVPFWQRFYETERKRLEDLPIDTTKQRVAFVNEVQNATALDLTPFGLISADPAAPDNIFAHDIITLAAERLMAKGFMPQPVYYNSNGTLCRFLKQPAAIDVKGPNQKQRDMRLWEIASGIPAPYWTDQTITTYLELAKSCKGNEASVGLSRILPDIRATWTSANWLRGKTAQYLNLPETLEAYREADWFLIDEVERITRNISDEDYERLFVLPLKDKKDAMDKAAKQAFTSYFSSHKNLNDNAIIEACTGLIGNKDEANQAFYVQCLSQGKDAINNAEIKPLEAALKDFENGPKNLASLAKNGWLEPSIILKDNALPQKLIDDFYAKAAPIRNQAINAITKEILDIFATVKLDDEALPIIETCRSLSKASSTDLVPIAAACDEGMGKLASRREQAKCDQLVRATGVDKDMIDAFFYANQEALGKGLSLRDFICKSEPSVTIKIVANGTLWWANKSIDITLKNDEKSHIKADLVKAGNGYTFSNIKSSGLFSGISASDILGHAR